MRHPEPGRCSGECVFLVEGGGGGLAHNTLAKVGIVFIHGDRIRLGARRVEPRCDQREVHLIRDRDRDGVSGIERPEPVKCLEEREEKHAI
jgi:hypothetical protein